MVLNEHDRDPWDLPQSSFEVLVAGGDYEAPELGDSADYAVVCVGSFVAAGQPFEPRVFG